MASENKDMAAAASDSKNNEDQQNLVSRVASVSLSAACEMVSTTYSSIKENIPVFRSFCDVAETGMRSIASAAVSGVQPLFSKPQTADVQDSRDLDKVEEKESLAQGPDDQGSPDKKETESSTDTVAAAAVVCQAAAETKDVVPGMLDLVKEAVRGSVEMTTSALTSGMNTVMGSSIGQMASSAVEAVMGKSEEMVDHYLPMSDEELATLAAALEEPEASSIEKQRQQRSYYVRLGSLSNRVRQRAYQHTLGKLRQTKQKMQETLSQLQQAMDLIAFARHADQKDQDGQEELRQKWLEWSKNQLGQSDSTGENPAEMESQALGMSRNIAQQMQAACQSLLANMQGLPAALQEKVQQAYSYMEELQAAFSSAKSFQELPSGLLTQRQETMGKIWQAGDEVLAYVTQSTPLNWIVGPFSPEEVSPPEPLAESQAAEAPPSVKESEVDVPRMEVPGSSALNNQA